MSVVTASELNDLLADQPDDEIPPEGIETEEIEAEEPIWTPRHIHVPRPLVWVLLLIFGLIVIMTGMLGLARSTLTYGMIPVDSTTTARLANINRALESAGVPSVALRHVTIAAQPGINIGDAAEALADANRDLEPYLGNPVVAAAQAELHGILNDLNSRRYGISWPPTTETPRPTFALPIPTP